MRHGLTLSQGLLVVTTGKARSLGNTVVSKVNLQLMAGVGVGSHRVLQEGKQHFSNK